MAWELGGGLGHTLPLGCIGTQLEAKGHTISYALRNPKTAEILKFNPDTQIFPAPVMGVQKPNLPAAYDYADLLLIRDYENAVRLDSKIDAWFRIFEEVQPDQLVADYAPCARLAAHIAGIPSHTMGNGFLVPPFCNPLHPFRGGREPDALLQQNIEMRLDKTINATLKRYGKHDVDRAIDIFIGGSRFIRTVEELDAYQNRKGEKYYGSITQASGCLDPVWPIAEGPRVFVYLAPGGPFLPLVCAGLRRMGISTLVFAGSQAASQLSSVVGPTINFTKEPVDISKLAGRCDLVINHGGNGTLAGGLAQGIPVLIKPHHIEQIMTCANVQKYGLGKMLPGKIEEDHFVQTVKSILDDEVMHENVKAFAIKYQSLTSEGVSASIATVIDAADYSE
ncbi:MAG: hypothetical protein HON65_09080 [Rhodospirillales bacterium]|nr:hypothetical protein [Rhodospirillales bacterium]